MFPQLRPLVPPEESLTALARAMLETGLSQNTPEDPPGDNPEVPAGFTYLGQFIDHDLTLDITSPKRDAGRSPLPGELSHTDV